MREMVYSNEIDSVLEKKITILETGLIVKKFYSKVKLGDVWFRNGHKITEFSSHEILHYYFTIFNCCGLYPACYIRIPDTSVFANAFRSKINDCEFFDDYAHVHGGFTFYQKDIQQTRMAPIGDWIGWDYSHLGDHIGTRERHKYTSRELDKDVMDAIDQLFESEQRIMVGDFDRRLLEND